MASGSTIRSPNPGCSAPRYLHYVIVPLVWSSEIRIRAIVFSMAIPLLAVLMMGCGPAGRKRSLITEASAKTVEQALATLKSLVDSTAAAVAGGFAMQPDNRFQETACEKAAGSHGGTFSAPYSIKITLPAGTDAPSLFAKAKDYWERNGYQVGKDKMSTSDPRLHATLDGYQLVLHIPSGSQFAYLDGGTPCLPEATTR